MSKIVRALACCALAALFCVSFSFSGGFAQMLAGARPSDGILPSQEGADESTPDENRAQFVQAAQSENLTLFADMEKGWFAVRNDRSGTIWYSTPNNSLTDTVTTGSLRQELRSDIVVGYIFGDGLSENSQINFANSQTGPLRSKTVAVSKIKDGVRVVYDFMAVGLRVPVTYVLENDGLKATLLCREVLEGEAFVKAKQKEGVAESEFEGMQDCRLVQVWLLPAFGAQTPSQTGYLFVPDGSGALVNFKQSDKAEAPYEKLVYGADAAIEKTTVSGSEQSVRLPVFGVVNGADAMMGIVTRGEAGAAIRAYKADPDCFYTGIGSKANFRLLAQTTLYQNQANSRKVTRASDTKERLSEYEVTYYFLDGQNANYSGVAQRYRTHLLDTKELAKRTDSPAVVLDILGAADTTANFLGFSYSKSVSLTSFAQASEIVGALNAAGLERIAVRYLGWNNNGLLNKKIAASASPLKLLGGRAGFLPLAKSVRESGNLLYPDADLLRYSRSGKGISASRDAVQTVFGLPSKQRQYLLSTFEPSNRAEPYLLVTPSRLPEIAGQFLSSYHKLGIERISLGTMSYLCYSDLGKKNLFYRAQLPGQYRQILSGMGAYGVMAENANAYMFSSAERIVSAPACSGEADIFERSVPFYQIVTHGYIPVTSPAMNGAYDGKKAFLKTVETGSELYCAVMAADPVILRDTRYNGYYSTGFEQWKPVLTEQYQAYHTLLNRIYKQPITAHDMLDDGVFRTEYAGGIRVYVNYSQQAYPLSDHQSIPALDFIWTGGNANE